MKGYWKLKRYLEYYDTAIFKTIILITQWKIQN